MSLAEGLLLDSLYDPPVVTQEIFLARRSDASPGAGTFLNPYSANTAADFDARINAVPAYSCVRLGPGTFFSNGGLALADGVRVVGCGREVTTVQLTHDDVFVFGQSHPPQRTGVEICELCIDVQHRGGAICMTGVNLVARGLRIINWMPDVSDFFILNWLDLIFWPADLEERIILQLADSTTGQLARNCIVDDCIFDAAGTVGDTTQAILLKFAGASTTAPHQFCVARRSEFEGDSVLNDFVGIDAGLGRGFIAEENQFFDLKTGIRLRNAPAWDLIFWNNAFNVTRNGIQLVNSDATAVVRAIVMENTFALARDTSGTDSIGISIEGNGIGQNFTQLIARKNVIAADASSSGTNSLKGIQVKNVTNPVVENNMIDDCDASAGNALGYASCFTFKSFNNQNTAGSLLRAYDLTNARYLMELQDFTEDALIGF